MREAVIVSYVRTPFVRRNSGFHMVRADDLLACALNGVVDRVGLEKGLVEDIIVGCVTQVGEQGANIGRLATLVAGFPETVPALSLNRMCSSSQQAVHFAAQAIISGDMDIVIAGGVEGMSRVPLKADGRDFNPKLKWDFKNHNQGLAAEMIAKKWGLTRQHLDEFSLRSHHKALEAIAQGRFQDEIIPVTYRNEEGQEVVISSDIGPRAETSLEKLGSLKTVFSETGVVTAGNSSQLTDGATAMLLMSADKARELGINPLGKIAWRTVVGVDPLMMLTGPIPATQKVLQRSGLTLDDMSVIEINEAFASVVLAWQKELQVDMDKVNPNGGAIALGHPVGASGVRLIGTLCNELNRRQARYGLVTICVGYGMANATIIDTAV